jgi:uncharacterized protein YacL (UPF0231 family)
MDGLFMGQSAWFDSNILWSKYSKHSFQRNHCMDTAIKSKLQALLRLGLVSQNNVRRAMTLFSDPERYARSPAYRTLMQEILVDVVDTILKNRVLYTALRSSLTKTKGATDASETVAATSQKLGEGIESDRTTALLRSGLVDKEQITAARKALKSKNNMKSMSMGKVYREMMINMLDSMVKKITGSPSLFNAFKYTMGKETVEEGFDWACEESIALCGLHEDAQEILEANKPTNPSLWSQAKSQARSKFKVYPSAYANGWAVKWYNSKGGGWKSVSEGKSFFDFSKNVDEAWEGSPAQAKLKKAKADYAAHAAEIKKPVPPARGSTHPMARQDTKSGKMYWAADRRKKAGTGTRRASDVSDERSGSVSE